MGTGTNETLKTNAFNGYVDGFVSMCEKGDGEVWTNIDHLNQCLGQKVHNDDTFIIENIIEHGKESIMLIVHGNKLNDISQNYLDNSEDFPNDSDNNPDNDKEINFDKDKE